MVFQISPQIVEAASSAVIALFTVVLAIATGLYYYQSRLQTNEIANQTREMEQTRKLRYEPKLKAGLKTSGPNFEIGFVNIGGGIAHNVECKYWVEGLEEYKREWGTSIHFPDDIYRIGIPIDDSNIGVVGMSDDIESKLGDVDDTFIVKWEYENIKGDVIKERQEFSLFEELERRSQSTEFYAGKSRDVRF